MRVYDLVLDEPPAASDDGYGTNEDTQLSGENVLTNDDTDGPSATACAPGTDCFATLGTNVSNGTLVLNADGSFIYDPDTDWCGQDSFTYDIDDGALDESGSPDATVTIDVTCVNDPPTVTVDPTSQTTQYSDDIGTVTITCLLYTSPSPRD